ncbi:MAG: UvrD-helicase domain-containing protein [Bacteroidales bacterium]
MSPLHLYRASAGSGKTFALTLEYLKLMFRTPGSHRNILAVTFTNRAAGEMKERILRRLHALSTGSGPQHPEEMETLKSVSDLDEEGVKERARELLNRILNDYSWFSVGTIDKFFQSVIRAFTHEIGIQPAYNLELDHRRILSLAVDRLFHELGEYEELQQWLIRYAEERMEESKSWNFRDDMVELGMQLFRESFQGLFLEQDMALLDKQHLKIFQEKLGEVVEEAVGQSSKIGQQALERIRQAGAEVEDFKLRGNSPPSLFREAVAGNALNFTDSKLAAMEDPGKWLKKDADAEMIRLTEQVLMPLYRSLYDQHAVLNTVAAIRKNMYTMGILGDLWERVRQYTNERNLFLIADSSRFLKGIIGGNQVPFIYERTGNRYHQIMLDEFQDTSVFQYDNFRPLLDEALAGGFFNLVVGDVKQSIYRWRNSDWNILATELERDFSHQDLKIHRLDRNYRSREMIIRFNNSVFQLAPQILSRQIADELLAAAADKDEVLRQVNRFDRAYEDAVQQFGQGQEIKGGAVRMEFFREQEEEGFRESVLRRIPFWIREIRDAGIEPGEVAILVRNRREGSMVANALLEHARETGDNMTYRLVSSESLLLGYNQAVTLILSALRYMVYPGEALNNALLKYLYSLGPEGTRQPDHAVFDSQVSPEDWLGDSWTARIVQMNSLPLYELVESLIDLFKLDRKAEDLPYLQAFQDVIIDIQRRESMGIAEFLQYWDQYGTQKGIASAEEANALRIMTIHKAKGLEFRAVMVPFCHWEITTDQRKSNILWCETKGTPFHELPLVPVRYGGAMQHTLFSSFYYQERMKGYMDNLNLMYVAFTRAKEVLYLGVPEREEEKLDHIGDLLQRLMPMVPDKGPALDALNRYRREQLVSVGALPAHSTPIEEPGLWQFSHYPVTRRKLTLKVRMRSDEYFVDGERGPRSVRMFGNVMHQLFSGIDDLSDIDRVVEAFHREGLLPGDAREQIREYIHEQIDQAEVRDWFSAGHQQIFKERSILCGDGVVIRPDRVMVEGDRATVVDFKFGEVEREQDQRQVARYMQHLEKLGYSPVHGYVWYVNLGKTIQIPMT